MPIYLTGGGDQENFNRLDKLFVEELPKGAKIGLFGQACVNSEDALERIQDCFDDKKISLIELVDNPAADLDQYDALIIEGGNTFKLIRSVRDTQFFTSIQNFAKTGKSIYADSAGAIILGSDVHTAFLGDDADEDEMSLQDYRGLDLLNSWCIHAHAVPDDFEDCEEILYQTGSPILALAEETGIILRNNEVEVFGHEDLWVIGFEGRSSYAPGDKLELP
jgi:dipeptidase E